MFLKVYENFLFNFDDDNFDKVKVKNEKQGLKPGI